MLTYFKTHDQYPYGYSQFDTIDKLKFLKESIKDNNEFLNEYREHKENECTLLGFGKNNLTKLPDYIYKDVIDSYIKDIEGFTKQFILEKERIEKALEQLKIL